MLVSINPANGEKIAEYSPITYEEVEKRLMQAERAWNDWVNTPLDSRKDLMRRFVDVLRGKRAECATLITLEMGKPIRQSFEEIDKCVLMAEWFIDHIEGLVQEEIVDMGHSRGFIEFEPLGVILAIMPWNFPFWQVLRAAVPNLLLGNVFVLKHASNVQGCASKIEELFSVSGFPAGVLQNFPVESKNVEPIIRHPVVRGVTLTGSEFAGSKVASIAGSEVKKTVMELGGNDPFIVLSDAELQPVCRSAGRSRLRNSGQACTAAKRFIVMKDVADEFIRNYVDYFKSVRVGDPFYDVDVGPLVSEKALEEVEAQVQKSVNMGAKIEIGGKRLGHKGFFYEPTIITNVSKGMPAYDEEIFGPVASVIVAESEEDLIYKANDTRYGLSASIWTKDLDKAKALAKKIQAGSVFINSVPSSDPRIPFGGIKKSGYGRELSRYGLLEFVNIKPVVIGF